MYTGRSIGRQLDWLRGLMGSADLLKFHEDGTIRMYDDSIVVRRVEWDAYDNPMFDFVDRHFYITQVQRFEELQQQEFDRIRMALKVDDIKTLRELDEHIGLTLTSIGKCEWHATYKALVDCGLVLPSEKMVGWDEKGAALYDVLLVVSLQGRGFLRRCEAAWQIQDAGAKGYDRALGVLRNSCKERDEPVLWKVCEHVEAQKQKWYAA